MSEDLLLCAQLGHADHISRLVAEGTDLAGDDKTASRRS
jgi:hypothetical protein